MGRDTEGTGTLGKAMAVLEVVAMAERPQRFTDILMALRQPRGTLHRLLGHLVEEGLLVQRPDLSYEPGLRLLKFAYRSWSGNRFREIAAPYLLKLHQLTGETVHLGVLRETEIIYVDKVESQQTVRMSSQIGKASPAYCTGIGKAALSVLPSSELQRISARMEFRPFTPKTHRSAETLYAEIAEIRHDGHAFDREEHEAEICCVAAPISVPDHDLIGGDLGDRPFLSRQLGAADRLGAGCAKGCGGYRGGAADKIRAWAGDRRCNATRQVRRAKAALTLQEWPRV